LKDASIADIFWGPGFVLVAWISYVTADGFCGRKLLVAGIVTLWGLRLAIHIATRNIGKGEDPRYQAWRAQYGKSFWWVSLFKVFLLQGVLLWVIAVGFQAAMISRVPDTFVWQDVLGTVICAIGLIFEAVADFQLRRFKADPGSRGKVMDRGLWAYSRHPNYFGESLVWWGLSLIALADISNAWTLVSPVLITFLLLRVSGVSLLERHMTKRRPAYEAYTARTSAFIPWFPKKQRDDRPGQGGHYGQQ
jgi:steroid 5-alpha reductase family enzyme